MSLPRRKFLKISLGASATPLLLRWPTAAQGNAVTAFERQMLHADPSALQVDGQVVAAPDIGRDDSPRFYDVEFPVPAAAVPGKDGVTVRFEADPDSQIATIFGLRMIRGDARR